MKSKCFVILSICLLLVAAFAFGAAKPAGLLPDAAVPQDSYEFAAVPEGREVVHGYIIRNTGRAPLSIQKVQTG